MHWDELSEEATDHRMDWANRAYENFMAELDPTIRKAAAGTVRPQVDAALYGETQVGKTTMLLTLLGVRPDAMEEVGVTLRADRPRGHSSTPTATRYRVGTDDKWTINVGPGPEPVAEPELRRRINDVRTAVEAGRWPLETVVEIAIPSGYFERAGGNRARILDLPGVQAVNAGENEHARRLIDKWVTLADVVLLVTRVDRLPPLRPNRLVIEALRHWPRQLSKFRVVLTHTYSNENTANWLDETAPAGRTLRGLRSALRGAFGSTNHFPNLDRTSLQWLYPVEFVDSWRAVADPDGRGARGLRDEAMAALQRDLTLAVRPENRLRRTFETHDLALEIAANLRRSWDNRIKKTHQRIARLETALQRQGVLAERQAEELGRVDEAVAAVDRLAEHRIGVAGSAPDLTTDDRRADLGGLRGQLRLDADTAWRTFQDTERRRVRRPVQAAGLELPPRTGADRLQAKIDGILADAFTGLEIEVPSALYLFFAWKSWEERLARIQREARSAYARAAGEIEERLQAAAGRRTAAIHAVLAEAREALTGQIKRTRKSIGTARSELRAAHERVETREAERTAELAVMEQHVEVAGQFPAYLYREYSRHRAELLRDVEAARNPLEKLARAAALVQAAETYDRIRNGD